VGATLSPSARRVRVTTTSVSYGYTTSLSPLSLTIANSPPLSPRPYGQSSIALATKQQAGTAV